jgi:hypothetical protein
MREFSLRTELIQNYSEDELVGKVAFEEIFFVMPQRRPQDGKNMANSFSGQVVLDLKKFFDDNEECSVLGVFKFFQTGFDGI